MRYAAILMLFCLSACFFLGALANDDKPYWDNVSSRCDSSGNLKVHFEEKKLCRKDDVHYKICYKVKVNYACENKAGKVPNAANKRTTVEKFVCVNKNYCPVKSGWFWEVCEDVTVSSGIPSCPPDFCPPGLQPVRESISYCEIKIRDEDNNTSCDVDDADYRWD